jgi:hypothetical protein
MFCGCYCQDGVSLAFWYGLPLNYAPPDLCLLSSWDYRYEPPDPVHLFIYSRERIRFGLVWISWMALIIAILQVSSYLLSSLLLLLLFLKTTDPSKVVQFSENSLSFPTQVYATLVFCKKIFSWWENAQCDIYKLIVRHLLLLCKFWRIF